MSKLAVKRLMRLWMGAAARRVVDEDPAVDREVRMQGHAEQASLATGIDVQREEGRGKQRPVLDDAQRAALRRHEQASVGCLGDGGGVSAEPRHEALVLGEAALDIAATADADGDDAPRGEILVGIACSRAQHVLAGGVVVGVEACLERRARIGCDCFAVDLEFDRRCTRCVSLEHLLPHQAIGELRRLQDRWRRHVGRARGAQLRAAATAATSRATSTATSSDQGSRHQPEHPASRHGTPPCGPAARSRPARREWLPR